MDKDTARERLLEWCPPGTLVYLVLRHVSRSGMLRVIDPIAFADLDVLQPRYVGRAAAVLLGWRYDEEREGLRVHGAGMDMGFHLVYELATALYRGTEYDRSSASPGRRAPGYLLSHRWL